MNHNHGQITAAYRDTVRWLEQVRDGKTDPGVESRTAASPDGENLITDAV
ncbi:phage protein Gp36 family protein [Escherichia coli]